MIDEFGEVEALAIDILDIIRRDIAAEALGILMRIKELGPLPSIAVPWFWSRSLRRWPAFVVRRIGRCGDAANAAAGPFAIATCYASFTVCAELGPGAATSMAATSIATAGRLK